nr:hypothetical protein [Phyllobacterium myrsinacearum]
MNLLLDHDRAFDFDEEILEQGESHLGQIEHAAAGAVSAKRAEKPMAIFFVMMGSSVRFREAAPPFSFSFHFIDKVI